MIVEEKTGAILASPRDPFIRNDGLSFVSLQKGRARTKRAMRRYTLRLFRRAPGEDWASSVERVRQACVERLGGAL
ncbi:hypothetical protein [Paraburkholderia sp. CI3]|uniref:hypothetical protein n=1 Tax=Paraburkholderia sp. CI3 TaxID=2991060 RepID=UPI003D1CCD5C